MGSFSPRVEQKSPLTFSGGKQEFVCEIGLFRRLPGTALFSQRIGPGTAVELGEEVQLRSIVRGNDGKLDSQRDHQHFKVTSQIGWFHSKLTDVVVRRLKKTSSSIGDGSANLVLSDGCRNPSYKVKHVEAPREQLLTLLIRTADSGAASAARSALDAPQQLQFPRVSLPRHGGWR